MNFLNVGTLYRLFINNTQYTYHWCFKFLLMFSYSKYPRASCFLHSAMCFWDLSTCITLVHSFSHSWIVFPCMNECTTIDRPISPVIHAQVIFDFSLLQTRVEWTFLQFPGAQLRTSRPLLHSVFSALSSICQVHGGDPDRAGLYPSVGEGFALCFLGQREGRRRAVN